ncbi:MAG: Mur ligase family protein [Candidatus Moraniibacteriota bacterium]
MKKILKIFLQYYLKIITKAVLLIHKPTVIAVAGSVNKSFVRDEVKKMLLKKGKNVRANPKNFNTEIGLPLAILGLESGYNSYRRWLPIIGQALRAIFQKNFPDCLVLELGVSQKGDMRYLLSIVQPKIVIVTEITQRYMEFFAGMERLVGEYVYLAEKLKKGDTLILNYENKKIKSLKKHTRAKVLFFGEDCFECDGYLAYINEMPQGLKVKMLYRGREKEIEIKRFGNHHARSALIAWMVEDLI